MTHIEFPAMRRVARAGAPPYYVFDALDPEGLAVHGVFTRHGGVSAAPFDTLNVSSSIGDDADAVNANRARVLAALDRPRRGLVMAGLVHGVVVARVDAATPGAPLDGGGRYIPRVDALVTDDPAVTLALTAADCAQVFIVDPRRRAVGLAHVGWRGTAVGAGGGAVRPLRQRPVRPARGGRTVPRAVLRPLLRPAQRTARLMRPLHPWRPCGPIGHEPAPVARGRSAPRPYPRGRGLYGVSPRPVLLTSRR